MSNNPGISAKNTSATVDVIVPVLKESVTVTVVGIIDILGRTEALSQQFFGQARAVFRVRLMSTEQELTVTDANDFPIRCHTLLRNSPRADIIFVPGLRGIPSNADTSHPLVHWLRSSYEQGATLCGACTGAFFLAATGLLDEQEAAMSWFAADAFRTKFPRISLKDERIIVDNGRIVTGGASTSFINLCIYLIEKFHGKSLGNYCAKMLLVNKSELSQRSYTIFAAQKNHQDKIIEVAQQFIEENVTKKIKVGQVLAQIPLSGRNFTRRFKAATGVTPLEYMQRLKIEYAKRRLEEDRGSIKEISYDTGYTDINYFRSIFKRYTGLTPLAYRKQFSFE